MKLTENDYNDLLDQFNLDDIDLVFRVVSTNESIFIISIRVIDLDCELFGPAPTTSVNDAINWFVAQGIRSR